MIKPISPNEITRKNIPDSVIMVVNKLISKNYYNEVAVISQVDVINELIAIGFAHTDIFKNHWLDFENLYREAGWKVVYDKPGYNESYDPFWRFTKAC